MSAQEKAKGYFALGRMHLAPFTSFGAVLGACTSRVPSAWEALALFLVGICAHSFAFGAYDLASFSSRQRATAQESLRSPIRSGKVSSKGALAYSSIMLSCAVLLSLASFRTLPDTAAVFLVACLAILALHAIYTRQRRFFADLAVPLAVALSVFYGAAAIGEISAITIALAPCAFLAAAFVSFENAVERVESDRQDGTQTLPVILGHREWRALGVHNPAFVYALVLKCAFIACCVAVAITIRLPEFTAILLTFGILTQVYSIHLLEGRQNKKSMLKLKLTNDSTTFVLLSAMTISVVGFASWIVIASLPMLWVMSFSYAYHKYDWHGNKGLIARMYL